MGYWVSELGFSALGLRDSWFSGKYQQVLAHAVGG